MIHSIQSIKCTEEGKEKEERVEIGTYYFKNGDRYIGELKNGEKHGKGEYYYSLSKNTYIGDWENDIKHGEGTLFLSDGKKKIGCWKNDRFTGIKKQIVDNVSG